MNRPPTSHRPIASHSLRFVSWNDEMIPSHFSSFLVCSFGVECGCIASYFSNLKLYNSLSVQGRCTAAAQICSLCGDFLFFFLNIIRSSLIAEVLVFFYNFSGATHSTVIICDQNGTVLSKVSGPGSNHWVIGIPEVARRVSEMIGRAKTEANIDVTHKLRTLGLSLSGCEQVSSLTPFISLNS